MKDTELRRNLERYVLPRTPAGAEVHGRRIVLPPVDWLLRGVRTAPSTATRRCSTRRAPS